MQLESMERLSCWSKPARTSIKVTDDQMNGLSIRRTGFHCEWNYTFTPRN